mgnify:CR=1 FL=1
MAQLLIRNLEDNVVEALKKRAAAEGKSLEQSLRDLLREAALPEVSSIGVPLAVAHTRKVPSSNIEATRCASTRAPSTTRSCGRSEPSTSRT